jgi:hypothetical protein
MCYNSDFKALHCCSCIYVDITGNEVICPVFKAPLLAHFSFKNGKNEASEIAMLHVAVCVGDSHMYMRVIYIYE